MIFSPLIPSRDALFQLRKMLGICHESTYWPPIIRRFAALGSAGNFLLGGSVLPANSRFLGDEAASE
jgi:hypothetical protein